jgi:hypothetical protein
LEDINMSILSSGTITETATTKVYGKPKVLLNDVDITPVGVIGLTPKDSEVSISCAMTKGDDTCDEYMGALCKYILDRKNTISIPLAQIDFALVQTAFGLADGVTGRTLDLMGEVGRLPEFAARVILTNNAGAGYHWIASKCVEASEEMKLTMKKAGAVEMPLMLEATRGIDLTGTCKLICTPASATNVTISSGTFARTNATPASTITWVKVAGEGSNPDTLTDITGGTTLVDGEIIRLQVFAVADPITITHASGVIELKGAADLVLSKAGSWIDLYYDLANTTWKEIARYTQP